MSVSEYQHQTISSFFQGSFKTSVKMAVLLMTSLVLSPSQAQEVDNVNNLPSATTTWYGTMPDSTPVYKVTLKNSHGVEADVISYGGTITRLVTPDKSGQSGNIVLGFDKLEDYLSAGYYFGAIIGRYGNRIADGKFTLNGTEYQLATNDGDNHLHGGVQGFDKKVWQMAPFATANSAGVVLTLISPDGDQGYPGKLDTQVTYTLTNSNTLDMAFTATTDKPTIVNLTQHSYFNLQGKGDILDHQLQINGDRYTPVDGGLIPTGEVASVKGTPFDFTQPKAIGKDINVKDKQLALGQGFDHNFVIKDAPGDELIEAANVYEPQTGRTLKVYTVEPAVQFYSGNFLDGSTQQEGMTHALRSGFCLEPQHNPDSPNQPDFASTVLNPGEVYSTRIVYEFGTK